MDIVDRETRSRMMANIRSKDTRAELTVRSLLHGHGYRFRVHRKDLPGSPDVCLPKYRLAIFVHGCFWHRHLGCPLTTTPANNAEKWVRKFKENVRRDKGAIRDLHQAGWRTLVIWECGIRKKQEQLPELFERWTRSSEMHEEWPSIEQ